MITHKRSLAFLVLFVLGMAPYGARAQAMEPMELHLVMSMGGVTAGSLMLAIDPGPDEIGSSLRMKSQGLFKLLTGYNSQAKAESTPGIDGGVPMPQSYDSTYETKKTERKILIRYDQSGRQIADLRTWKRGKPQKSKVPEDLWLETVDPLTAVLQLRHWIREGAELDGGVRALEIFDGRRRYRLTVDVLDRMSIELAGENRKALRFKVVMQPMAGFSKKDMLANWASEDGRNWIELIVTDDDNPLPVSMTTKGGALETVVYLRKVCLGEAGCKKVSS